tara:strand:- start:518 stop:901 length:384 start_codon:yes stop_codon:yes gene_type:complete
MESNNHDRIIHFIKEWWEHVGTAATSAESRNYLRKHMSNEFQQVTIGGSYTTREQVVTHLQLIHLKGGYTLHDFHIKYNYPIATVTYLASNEKEHIDGNKISENSVLHLAVINLDTNKLIAWANMSK